MSRPVTAWVKPNLHPSNSQLIVRHSTTGLRGWSLSIDTDGRPVFQLRGYSGVDKWGVAKHDTVVTDGDWHFIAGTIEYTTTRSQALSGTGRVSIYVDGEKQPSDGDDDGNDGLSGDDFDILATALGGKSFSVGRSGFNLDGLTGKVDDIRVFDRALLPPEVLARFWENRIFSLDQGFSASTGLGTKLYSLDYNGDALTVAKVGDSSGHAVGFADCDLDGEDLENYAGGEDVFAKTIFDQDGSGNNNAVQNNQLRQPQVVDGPNGSKVFSVFRSQGMSISGSYNDIRGADELTIFFAAKWDGSPSSSAIQMLTAGNGIPAGGPYPLSMYLFKTTFEYSSGKPYAEVKVLQNGQTVRKNLEAKGTFGRRNVFETYELVFDSNDKVALYNSGRLVSEVSLNGYPLIVGNNSSVFWGSNSGYNNGFTGKITPPLIFKSALSDSERDTVRESLAGAYGIPLPDNSPPSGDEYTIVVLPDTQRYAVDTLDPEHPAFSSEPQEIQDIMDWIDSNKSSWNIQLVLQPGDIVDNAVITVDHNQWDIAEPWFGTLDNTGIPFAVVPGNHDYIDPIANRDSTNYNTYFPTTRFDCSSWTNCGGIEFFETNKTDNLFYTLTIQGEDYLILTLEFQPRDSVVTWANTVLTTHNDKKAIVLTHDFMNENGTFDGSTLPAFVDANSGSELYNELMSQHSNIFLVINGHHARGASRRFDSGTGAHYLFFDPMLKDWGGLGHMRLLVASPSNKTIRVMTHSPDSNIYRNDYQNLFTLDLP